MLFVPLPLFASLLLVLIAIRFVRKRDMSTSAHKLFAALIWLYALQSFLTVLRWGYGMVETTSLMALLAPCLPVLAYLAYSGLTATFQISKLWPLLTVPLNWLIWLVFPSAADITILISYLGFGALLVALACSDPDRLALTPLDSLKQTRLAILLTGLALIGSAATDIYIFHDFISNQGRNVALVVTFVQSGFALLTGVAAAFGRASNEVGADVATTSPVPEATHHEDADIIRRLEALFEAEGLHRREDLSLRRLSRRLQLPDRRVSNAINRARQMSVSQFVNEYRIKDACELLLTTEDTILTVSLKSGFATKSNFNREFARIMGKPPSAWRREAVQAAQR